MIWNNCGVMHRVVPYDEASGRMMHRTTIMGAERLESPGPHRSRWQWFLEGCEGAGKIIKIFG